MLQGNVDLIVYRVLLPPRSVWCDSLHGITVQLHLLVLCLAALTYVGLMVVLCRFLLVLICPYKICVPMGWVGPLFVAAPFNESLGNLGAHRFPSISRDIFLWFSYSYLH